MAEGDFLSFRALISTTFIKIIYAGGMVAITIIGLAGSIVPYIRYAQNPDISPDTTLTQSVAGILILVFGNLIWRFMCESFILFFSVHELVGAISKQSQLNFEQLRATEANNEIRHEELLMALSKLRS